MKTQGVDSREQVLDQHVFEELLVTLGNDTDRVTSVYRRFVESACARLDDVRAQAAGDSAATFHALKGSASMVGANRLAALAAKFQEAAPGLDNETKVSAVSELEAELTVFRDVLAGLLARI